MYLFIKKLCKTISKTKKLPYSDSNGNVRRFFHDLFQDFSSQILCIKTAKDLTKTNHKILNTKNKFKMTQSF